MRHNRFVSLLIVGIGVALLLAMSACGRASVTDEHSGEDAEAHAEERFVYVEPGQLEELGIRIENARSGSVGLTVELPGEVQVNGDRMAHVAPRVGGVVEEVFASLGDSVRRGQLLAVLESRELADAKAVFLATAERLKLADATFRREERLWKDRVSSEQDYLDARRGLAEARIERRAAEQKLHALGFSQDDLDGLGDRHDVKLTVYRLTAPFDGTIIDRHITIGETVDSGSPVFTVADLETVWIDLSVYQRDIGAVRAGQTAHVITEHGEEALLEIDFVQPLVGEETRTATARIVAPNTDHLWHPGCFVTAVVTTSRVNARIVVPASAVIRMEDGDEVVFVETDKGFEARLVETGRESGDGIEIVSGLEPGERYVAEGGFSLKAELGKDAFGDGHGH
jgi:cobalt-zinc-cadmium efflux system membrane fusion protein